jgi:hypothetical protein
MNEILLDKSNKTPDQLSHKDTIRNTNKRLKYIEIRYHSTLGICCTRLEENINLGCFRVSPPPLLLSKRYCP